MVRVLLPLLLMALTIEDSARAQAVSPVEIGDRVRVATSQDRFTGRVLRVSNDSLHLSLVNRGDALALSTGQIQSLKVRERRTRWGGAFRGAGLGLLAGAAVTGVLVAACAAEDCFDSGFSGVGVIIGGFYSIVSLTLIGAGVGTLLPGHRWKAVSLTPSSGMVPFSQGEMGLALTVRW